MENNTKDALQYYSAIAMLMFGVGLTTAGFIVSPVGEVSESVLMVLGQCIIFAGSVFGIGLYAKTKVDNRLNRYFNENKQ